MDLCNIPSRYYPAYTWLWNSTITRYGIREQLREMYDAGIRAFYVIGEPENFRPNRRNTHLSPEYLSEEYLELLHYAWEVGNSLGMTMWLYNEGGFPSGMVCGQIRQAHPELTLLELRPAEISLPGNTPYVPTTDIAAAFSDAVRIFPGQTFRKDTVIREYRICPEDYSGIRTDISIRRNTELFLQLTHEKLHRRFGDTMGSGISIMFDDEACMGTWSRDFDRIFRERYGYDILDYLPWIALPWQNGQLSPQTPEQHRAASDYIMLCGELVRDNYFTPMKQWLRQHNMCSAGHLDNDHRADGTVINRYGSAIIPMDESLILTAIDFSGRSYLGFDLDIPTAKVGSFDTELVEEFWMAFARSAACNLHIRKLAGTNSHHIIEGTFKSAARSARQAAAIDEAFADEVPSTKGVL